MKLGIIRLYAGESGKVGYYNIQEVGLAKALEKKGVNTDIFFLVNKKENKEVRIEKITDKIRIIYIPAFKVANHGIVSPKFILDYKLDIVHLLSDNQIMAPIFVRFCNKHNISVYNYVGTISSDTNNKIKKVVMDTLSNRNIQCFNKSNTVVKTLSVQKQLKNKGINNTKLIPVGLDLDIIPKIDKTKEELREELNIPLDKRVLIFVGRLEEYKEPIKAVDLMKEIRKNNNEYLLIIIGQGSLKDKMHDLIRSYKIEDNIIFIDKIENSKIHKYYKASDIFLNFNSKEIFGMSILEAMYQGCKVIAIEAPGPSYIINDNIDGVVMKDYDPTTWKKIIEKNINNRQMSDMAIEKIVNWFNWDTIAEKYLDLFQEIKGE